MVFAGLNDIKRGGGFGKCTILTPFWTDLVFFKEIKDFFRQDYRIVNDCGVKG